MRDRLHRYSVAAMSRVLGVHRSGFYRWLTKPLSDRAIEDSRLEPLIRKSWTDSGRVYGYRPITCDLKEMGETCGKNRVLRIMRSQQIKALRGYKRHPGFHAGTVHDLAENQLDRQFTVEKPDAVWVTDFTYVRTYEGWLYLCVVIDLFSRQVIGWSMSPRPQSDLVIKALLMALLRRQPQSKVLVHSDQGSQYTSADWRKILKENNLEMSMSRRGNCHDNAVAESFFSLLKKDRIRRRIYKTRAEARSDIFNYIEMFYNPRKRHGSNNMLSPIEFEKQYYREAGNCLQN